MALNDFTAPTATLRYFIEVMGKEKSGKSDFAMWAPETVCLLDLEGRAGIVRPETLARKIISKQYLSPELLEIKPKHGKNDELQKEAEKIIAEVDADFKDACNSRDVRSIVMDSGSLYDNLCTLSWFGRLGLEADKSYLYGQKNQQIDNLVKFARTSDKHVIWTHRVKPTYVKDEDIKREVWNGSYERVGYKYSGNLFDIGLFTRFDIDEKCFKAKVLYTTANAVMWMGEELVLAEKNSYAELLSILTGTDESEWQ